MTATSTMPRRTLLILGARPVTALLAGTGVAPVVLAATGSVWVAAAIGGVAWGLWPAVVEDVRAERIPNDDLVVAACVGLSVLSVAVAVGDVSDGLTAISGVMWGIALSGAAGLLLVWLLAPRLVGGGDVKMLAVEGAVVGAVDPRAAFVTGAVSVVVQLLAAVVLRRRRMPFAPALYAGLVAGSLSMFWFQSNVEVS